jgi:hypothetical protein
LNLQGKKAQPLYNEKVNVAIMFIVPLCCIFTTLHSHCCQQLLLTLVFTPTYIEKDEG